MEFTINPDTLSNDRKNKYYKSLKYLKYFNSCLTHKYFNNNKYVIEPIDDMNIYVYGGFIRYLISKDDKFSDIDIYLGNVEDICYNFSLHRFKAFLMRVTKLLEEDNYKVDVSIYNNVDLYNYGKAKMTINDGREDFIIDISTSINMSNENGFCYSCDYTVNNLYFQYLPKENKYGPLKIRQDCGTGEDYIDTIVQYFKDIKNKRLTAIYDFDKICKYIYRDYIVKSNEDDTKEKNKIDSLNKYINTIRSREVKMLEKGYRGDHNIFGNSSMYNILYETVTKYIDEELKFF